MFNRSFSVLLVLCFVSAAYAEAPFQDRSLDAALEKAAAEKKVVMIDFYTTWCGPCKMLDKQTWPDKDVRTWIDEHAIALKVDAEKKRDLAKRFKVRAYPTIVFVKPDGTQLDSIVGFRGPKDFIAAAKGALSGKPADVRAKEEFEEGDQNDPMERGRYADRLAQLGKHKEALEHYLWCFDEGVKHRPSYVGVRVSFLLSDIQRLGAAYPPAIKALEKRRDKAEQTVRDFVAGKKLKPADGEADNIGGMFNRMLNRQSTQIASTAAGDVAALNDTLEDNPRTIKLYDKVLECDRAGADEVRRWLFSRIEKDLIKARRYDDFIRDGNPLQELRFDIQMYRERDSHGVEMPQHLKQRLAESSRRRLAKSAGMFYEVYLGAGLLKEAEMLSEEILDVLPTETVFDELIDATIRAQRFELLGRLKSEAEFDLKKAEAQRIEKRINEVLNSPEAKRAKEKRAAERKKAAEHDDW